MCRGTVSDVQQRTIMSFLLLSLLSISKHNVFTLPTEITRSQTSQVDLRMFEGSGQPPGASVPDAKKLWSDGKVPYRMNDNLGPLLPNIQRAMRHIENQTCVQFVPASPDHTSYINITLREGCWSNVGRVAGGQEMTLGLSCGESIGVILHELLHVLGLWHEHARSDRDDYIDVLWNNIQEGEKGNFEKLQPWVNNLLDAPFDFDSVMLYGSMAFSKDGISPTLASRVPGKRLVDLANKSNLSQGDVTRLNKLYECNGENRPKPVDVPSLKCPFQSDLCGFTNQESQDLIEWTLSPEDGGVSLSWADDESFVAGRILSPYMKSYHREEGCLSFKLRFKGPAVKGIWVHKQTVQETEEALLEKDSEGPDTDIWLQMALIVPMAADFRFIFQGAIISGSDSDVILMKDLEFKWSPCNS